MDVADIKTLEEGDCVERELVLVKVRADAANRGTSCNRQYFPMRRSWMYLWIP